MEPRTSRFVSRVSVKRAASTSAAVSRCNHLARYYSLPSDPDHQVILQVSKRCGQVADYSYGRTIMPAFVVPGCGLPHIARPEARRIHNGEISGKTSQVEWRAISFIKSGSFGSGRITPLRYSVRKDSQGNTERKVRSWTVQNTYTSPRRIAFHSPGACPPASFVHKRWAQCGLCTNAKRLHVPRTNATAIEVH